VERVLAAGRAAAEQRFCAQTAERLSAQSIERLEELARAARTDVAGGRGLLFYGKDSELTGADREHQEVSMLAQHLLQAPLVHVNTLLLQRVLAEPQRRDRLSDVDRRGLAPLFWSNANCYGRFRLDMERHIDLELVAPGMPGGPPLVTNPASE
jgi:hypothetical protein